LSFAASPDPLPSLAQLTFPSNGLVNHQPIAAARSRTSSQLDLANWLLAKESTSEVDAPGLSAAAKRVCQKLLLRLSRLVSPAGSQAILSRALHLARGEFRFLEGVRAGKGAEAYLEGLGEQLQGVNLGEARAGLLTVIGLLLDLLVGFIGEELTLRLVRDVWPDVPTLVSGQSANSNGHEPEQ